MNTKTTYLKMTLNFRTAQEELNFLFWSLKYNLYRMEIRAILSATARTSLINTSV